MSRKFRGKFLSYVKKSKNLKFFGENKDLENPEVFNNLMQQMYEKEWIVYCKEPFKNAESVIQYLGRYTHRVAISNERIIKIEDGKVTFKWRDYKDNNQDEGNDSNNRRIHTKIFNTYITTKIHEDKILWNIRK